MFTAVVEAREARGASGVTCVRYAKLNLIDLAGGRGVGGWGGWRGGGLEAWWGGIGQAPGWALKLERAGHAPARPSAARLRAQAASAWARAGPRASS